VRISSASTWVAAGSGQRVELNAFTSPRIIEFVEHKFEQEGVSKLIPDTESLKCAFRRAWITGRIQEALDQAAAKNADDETPAMPPGLSSKISEAIQGTAKSWDDALSQIVRDMRCQRDRCQ
jgi:hypothetical protein